MKKYVFIVMIAILLLFQKYALANEYIVKVKNTGTVSLMSCGDDLKPLAPELGLYTTSDISNADMFEYTEEDAPVELFDTYDYSGILSYEQYTVTGVKSMWDIGVYGHGVRVGVIDSGCKPHIALADNLREGANFAEDNSDDTNDNIGHGTAVCGIIGAGYGLDKCIGAAHKTEIIPLKFIDCDDSGNTIGGTTARLAKAIIAAADDFDCDVINMSCGTIESNTLKIAVDYAVSKGIIVVAAVGNNGSDKLNYPAAYDNVIGVGSVNNKKEHSSFSNTNGSVFVTAPGENINILSGTDEETINSGTSFSAPCVSGIIAGMMEINPELTADSAMNILIETSEDLGEDGYDTQYGYGLVRADNIIGYMLSGCECFVSQIDLCSADGFNEVRFRIGDKNKPAMLFAAYSNEVMNYLNMDLQCVADNIYMLRLPKTDETEYKYFVWQSLDSMIPLADDKIIAVPTCP